MNASQESKDIAIITALPIERDAVLSRMDGYEIAKDGTFYQGHLTTKNHYTYSIVVGLTTEMGNVESGITAMQLLERFKPKIVFMLGIAAGRPEKVQLGDVVVAKYCYYYELGKLTPDGKQERLRQLQCSKSLLSSAKNYQGTDWHTHIRINLPTQDASHQPQVHFGPIGSGEKVIADHETLPQLLKNDSELLAVAMEGAGVASAVAHHEGVKFIEIRGICDFANPDKNDDWQPYAANAAGAFLMAWLRTVELLPSAVVKPPTEIAKDSPFPPIPKPDYFIGREALLTDLHQRLQDSGTVLLVNGLGGIGKSATAQQYAWQYQQFYHWVAWIFIQSHLQRDLLIALERPLQLAFPENMPSEERFTEMLRVLQQVPGRNLLILDNVNDHQALVDCRRALKTSGWQVLITSRCNPDDYNTLAVEELPTATAITLFTHHYQLPVEDAELKSLLEKVAYSILVFNWFEKTTQY